MVLFVLKYFGKKFLFICVGCRYTWPFLPLALKGSLQKLATNWQPQSVRSKNLTKSKRYVGTHVTSGFSLLRRHSLRSSAHNLPPPMNGCWSQGTFVCSRSDHGCMLNLPQRLAGEHVKITLQPHNSGKVKLVSVELPWVQSPQCKECSVETMLQLKKYILTHLFVRVNDNVRPLVH